MIPALDLSASTWRKSSYSDGGGTNCIEVADGCPGLMPVRDSKIPNGPTLIVAAPAWTAFVDGVRTEAL